MPSPSWTTTLVYVWHSVSSDWRPWWTEEETLWAAFQANLEKLAELLLRAVANRLSRGRQFTVESLCCFNQACYRSSWVRWTDNHSCLTIVLYYRRHTQTHTVHVCIPVFSPAYLRDVPSVLIFIAAETRQGKNLWCGIRLHPSYTLLIRLYPWLGVAHCNKPSMMYYFTT